MTAKQKYLLMKHFARLDRAYIELNQGTKKDFILKWTKKPLVKDGKHFIPKGSIVITWSNLQVLKAVIDEVETLLLNQIRLEITSIYVFGQFRYINGGRYYINPRYIKKEFWSLFETAKQTTLPSWIELLNDPNKFNQNNEFFCSDRLKRRWDKKELFKREGLEDLLSPKDLIKCI